MRFSFGTLHIDDKTFFLQIIFLYGAINYCECGNFPQTIEKCWVFLIVVFCFFLLSSHLFLRMAYQEFVRRYQVFTRFKGHVQQLVRDRSGPVPWNMASEMDKENLNTSGNTFLVKVEHHLSKLQCAQNGKQRTLFCIFSLFGSSFLFLLSPSSSFYQSFCGCKYASTGVLWNVIFDQKDMKNKIFSIQCVIYLLLCTFPMISLKIIETHGHSLPANCC